MARKSWTTGKERKRNKTGGQSIAVHFPIEEAELLAWAEQQGRANLSDFIRQALKSHRYLLEKYGPEWQEKLEEGRG